MLHHRYLNLHQHVTHTGTVGHLQPNPESNAVSSN